MNVKISIFLPTAFFSSYYHEKTYAPLVDLNDAAVEEQLLEKKYPDIAQAAQDLISIPEVQTVLSLPVSYDLLSETPRRNGILEKHNFTLLSIKQDLQTQKRVPFYTVIEHKNLPGWVIKSTAIRVAKDGPLILGPNNDQQEMAFFTEEEGLCRISMANRLRKIIEEAQINDVIVPEKGLVSYKNIPDSANRHEKYCVLSQKIDVLSAQETMEKIGEMRATDQRELAKKIACIIKKAGIVDSSFENIRLTKEGKLVFLDTEPAGLMRVKADNPGIVEKLFPKKGATVEKCARIGLYQIAMFSKPNRECCYFFDQIESEYKSALAPALSKKKIALTIFSFGILAAIYLVAAVVHFCYYTYLSIRLDRMRHKSLSKDEELVFYSLVKKLHRSLENTLPSFQREVPLLLI